MSWIAGDLLVGDQDVGVLQLGGHTVGVGDHVGAQIALVELHALDDVDVDAEGLGILDGDDAVLAHDLHGVGDLLADLGVAGGDGADVRDLLVGVDRLGVALISSTAALTPCRCRDGWPAGWRQR